MNSKAIDIPIYGGYDRKPSATGGGTDNPHKYYVFTREDILANDTVIDYLSTALASHGGTVFVSLAAFGQHDSENYIIRAIRGGGGVGSLIHQLGPEAVYWLAIEDCCQYQFMCSETGSASFVICEGNSFIDILNALDEDNPLSPYDRIANLLQEHEVTEEQYNAALDKIKNDTIS